MFGKIALVCGSILIALVVSAVLSVETQTVEYELQLIAPEIARFGDDIPVRASLFALKDEVQGPRLEAADVVVRVFDDLGREVSTTDLARTPMNAMEGSLSIPRAGGAYDIEAFTRDKRIDASVRSRITIAPMVPAPDVRERAFVRAPAGVRVGGGACVPEMICDVYVALDDEVMVGSTSTNGSFTSLGPVYVGTTHAHFQGVVHGLDAQTELSLVHEDGSISKRTLELPVALGQSYFSIELVPQQRHRLKLQGVAPGAAVVLDAFRRDAWIASKTVTLSRDDSTVPWPFSNLSQGVVCVQVRADVFASDSAATRCVNLDDHESDSATAGYMAAARETGALLTPAAASGLQVAQTRLEARKRQVRSVAIAVVIVLAAIVAFVTYQRGARAVVEARDLMRSAGASEAQTGKRITRDFATLLLTVALLCAAVLSVIAFLLARHLI